MNAKYIQADKMYAINGSNIKVYVSDKAWDRIIDYFGKMKLKD